MVLKIFGAFFILYHLISHHIFIYTMYQLDFQLEKSLNQSEKSLKYTFISFKPVITGKLIYATDFRKFPYRIMDTALRKSVTIIKK